MPLKKMQPNLRELELIFEEGEMYDWGREHGDLRTVMDDIRLGDGYRSILGLS